MSLDRRLSRLETASHAQLAARTDAETLRAVQRMQQVLSDLQRRAVGELCHRYLKDASAQPTADEQAALTVAAADDQVREHLAAACSGWPEQDRARLPAWIAPLLGDAI